MSLIALYAEAAIQEKAAKATKEAIGVKLLAKMKESETGTIKADFGTFSRAQKLVYVYPESFKEQETEMKEVIKKLKKEVELKLTPTVNDYLIFRAIK